MNAKDQGYDDGYNDRENNNPYNINEDMLSWIEYEEGYIDGKNDC
jgi:hypothetical protein